MRCRPKLLLPALITLVLMFSAAQAANKFNLKPGARGKNCLNCHADFQEKMKNPFVHTPVKKGECTGCHNPHAASHGKFLDTEAKEICIKCHADILPEKSVSIHKVVLEGECVKCHDPHAAKSKFNLLKPGNRLCFECHKEIGERVQNVKFKHRPVERGCVSCHNPHASATSEKLMDDSVPALCIKCHSTKKAVFKNKHMNYPVAQANCTSCHNPHGSNQRALIYDQVHKPFAKKMCTQCHEGPGSLKVKQTGFEMCKACHSNTINEMFAKKRVHWALLDQVGCLNCHSPHASDQEGLLSKPMMTVCGQCHSDTVERVKTAESKHPPVQEGKCTICHSPHASGQLSLIEEASVVDACSTCHEWGKHSTHPIGAKYIDKRNKNLSVTCLSCHRPHGTPYKKMMIFPTSTETCTDCHEKLKR